MCRLGLAKGGFCNPLGLPAWGSVLAIVLAHMLAPQLLRIHRCDLGYGPRGAGCMVYVMGAGRRARTQACAHVAYRCERRRHTAPGLARTRRLGVARLMLLIYAITLLASDGELQLSELDEPCPRGRAACCSTDECMDTCIDMCDAHRHMGKFKGMCTDICM